MTVRVAINGFGRIGRLVFRIARDNPDVEVVHINDLFAPKDLAVLLKYDSAHGRFAGTVALDDNGLVVDGRPIRVTAIRDLAALPWRDSQIDVVVEATGVFRSRAQCQQHIDAGARKVVLTVPAKDAIDATIVFGVNDSDLKPEHTIVSNASCTTNCVAQLAKVLHDAFGIKRGLMSTTHAYTNDQHLQDMPHKDMRRARAAAHNIVPTTTGAAKALGLVIPSLEGVLDGMSLRVPVIDGSITDLVVEVERETTTDEVNAAFRTAAAALPGILEYNTDPIVSADIVGNPHSCVFDADLTMVQGGTMVKAIGWYDNEWGYSNRVVELVARVAQISS